MARDASAELLTKQPQHCLAHWLAASADELIDAMAETKLFQNGSSPAAREKRVGVPIATARVKLGGAHINFIWLGEPPEGSVRPSPTHLRSSPPWRALAHAWSCSELTRRSPPLPSSAAGGVDQGAARGEQRHVHPQGHAWYALLLSHGDDEARRGVDSGLSRV